MIYDIVADETIKLDGFETLNECKDWVEQYLILNGFGQFKTIKIYDYGYGESPTMMEGYYSDDYSINERKEKAMPKYLITIQAVITKTYEVEADDRDEAIIEANEKFSCEPDASETYEQETVDVELVEGEEP